MARKNEQDVAVEPEPVLDPSEGVVQEPVQEAATASAEPAPTPEVLEGTTEPEDAPEGTYDPATQVYDEAADEVVDMPSGAWTAAVTDKGNLRHRHGLLILAP